MRLLVIGGSGFLGQALVAAAPPHTRATHHRSAPDGAVRWHPLDLADGGGAAAELIRSERPTAVINAAYVPAGATLQAVTASAPGVIAAACREIGARFVQVSSDVVFDGRREDPYVESDPPRPVHDYGRAKVAAEAAVAEADPGAVIVRSSLLWTPGPCAQVDLVRRPDITFFTDEVRCPLRVDRMAAACLELAGRADVHGPLHVAGADAVDRHDLACRLAPFADRDPATVRGGPGDPAAARPRHLHLDTTRARATLATPLPGVRHDLPSA